MVGGVAVCTHAPVRTEVRVSRAPLRADITPFPGDQEGSLGCGQGAEAGLEEQVPFQTTVPGALSALPPCAPEDESNLK